MKIFIDSHALERLVHPDLETRRQSLKELTSILKNNILFEAAAHQGNSFANEELQVVNLADLTKQLIRWFQYKPVTNSDEILDLLILVLSRKDFLRHITKTISATRLKKELIKIARMIIPENSAIKLTILEQLLTDFESETYVSIASDAGSFPPVGSPVRERIAQLDREFLPRFFEMEAALPPTSLIDTRSEDNALEVIDEHWVRLRGKDLELFNQLDESLLLYNDSETFTKSLKVLTSSLEDFPPEYFLQPPNMLETLMDIVWKVPNENGIEIVRTIRFIINGLRHRWIEAKKQRSSYIPVKKHLNKILQIFTNFFERFNEQFNPEHVAHLQETLNAIYLLLFDMIKFIRESRDFCEIYLNELLNMLAKVTKNFRLAASRNEQTKLSCRINYVVSLYLINIFIACIDTSTIVQFSQNNVWEFECDVALLDFTLKTHQGDIYNLILKNRADIIKEDADLELLLNVENLWKPVVQIYQCHETLTDRQVIKYAKDAIDVIRVVKNSKFVDVVFKALIADTQMRDESEEIFIRLISNEDEEIKLRAYELARESVQKKISDDQSAVGIDICGAVGIPLNTEIITEIICFGLLDERVQDHAKTILFALLRGKVVFPHHWDAILEIMKPVLAMTPCLFIKDQKLGFFAFDIFNQHSGFNKDELNQAYARFLFSSHPNARAMAKRKLLESYSEYTSDFIEIVPDDFCILPKGFITDLPMPERKLSFDADAYETAAQLLKSPAVLEDPQILQSVLLKLSVLMNSSKLCEKAHDDNLWVYFMASPDMNFPNNSIIRKLTINILFKWAVTIPYFRIYLSNEPKALQFIINTLIYYQDDPSIKKQASAFLFIVLFSDFIVINEKSTSLPNILSKLEVPFKFTKHWEESPFNKSSQIEWLYSSIKSDEDRDSDIREITLKHFRFTFANVWMGGDFSKDFNHRKNALEIPQDMMLKASEIKAFNDSKNSKITDSLIYTLNNLIEVGEMTRLVHQVVALLMVPNFDLQKFSLVLDTHVRKYNAPWHSSKDTRKFLFMRVMELYEEILPSLSDTTIVNLTREKPIESIVMSRHKVEEADVLLRVLPVVNAILKISTTRKDLAKAIIKRYSDDLKVHFPSRLVEQLFTNFFDNYVKTRLMNDVEAMPMIKMILKTIKNMLTDFPSLLDEQLINSAFQDMLNATKFLLQSSVKQSSAYVISLMLTIIERLCSLSNHIKLKPENFNLIFVWLSDQSRDNTLMWKIVAQLTKRNLHFIDFCRGFEEVMKFSFYDFVMQLTQNKEKFVSSHERRAQAMVVGNFLDFICESNIRDLGMKNNRKNAMEIKEDLVMLFIQQKPQNIDSICFLVKKMLHSNATNENCRYEVEKVVKQKQLVEFLLQNSSENLDTIVACYRNKDLKQHVSDILCGLKEEQIFSLLAQLKNPFDKLKFIHKKINKNLLSLILILLQSQNGYEKAFKALSRDQKFFNIFNSLIFKGIQSTNGFNEIMFHLEVISTLLNFGGEFFQCQPGSLMSGDELLKLSENLSSMKSSNILRSYMKSVQYSIDLLLLELVTLLESSDGAGLNAENKYELKAQIFAIVKKIMISSEQAQSMATKFDLTGIILNRLKTFILSIGNTSRVDMNKKNGAQKCNLIAKELCIFIKIVVEWNLSLTESRLEEILLKFLSVFNWIFNDVVLLFSFITFLRAYPSLRVAHVCITRQFSGSSIIQGIYKKALAISSKPPHTDSNLALLQNILDLFISLLNVAEIRTMLKASKVFQVLETLHPQLQKNRKTTWNDLTVMWLKFFEKFSRHEDTECDPNQISILCRLIRIDDKEIAKVALKVIRNVSMKSLYAYVVLHSNDFMETVNIILDKEWKSEDEKFLILQTLLSLASKSDQMRSKLKNSPFNRQLKDYLSTLQANENLQIYNLTTMLSDILYPQ